MFVSAKATATVTVQIPQFVRCVHCNTQFVSDLTVVGVGTVDAMFLKPDVAKERAAEEARREIERQLNDPYFHDPVPCPKCFKYQPYMRELLESLHNSG
jgi:hypothetical protein